jgi:exocyst complex component 7
VLEFIVYCSPQPGQLDVYQDTLERLNAAIAFKTMDRDARDTVSPPSPLLLPHLYNNLSLQARLIETGAKKLVQLYTKLVAEASSGPLPVTGPLTPTPPTPAPFPSSLLATLQPLVLFLRTLPTPTTHPSHPAASAIWTTLKEAQKGYAEMRGGWAKKGLEVYGRRCLDRAETVEGVVGGREVGGFVEGVLGVAEVGGTFSSFFSLLSLTPIK